VHPRVTAHHAPLNALGTHAQTELRMRVGKRTIGDPGSSAEPVTVIGTAIIAPAGLR
jgi:hypothetical protein